MNRRAKKERRIRDGAWALVAALLPTTECLAADGAAVDPANPGTSAVTTAAPDPAPIRPKIPPPRIWSEIQGTEGPASAPATARPKIPPPRQFATAAEAGPAAPATPPSPSVITLTEPAPRELAPPQELPAPSPVPTLSPVTTPAAAPLPTAAAPREVEASSEPKDRVIVPDVPQAGPAFTPSASQASAAPAPSALSVNPPPMPSAPEASTAPASSAPEASAAPASSAFQAGAAPAPSAPQAGVAPTPSASQGGAGPMPGDADLGQTLSRAVAAGPAQVAPSNPMAAGLKDDSQVAQTGCATCGGFHKSSDGPAFHESMGCPPGGCIPGRPECDMPCNDCDTVIGAFCQNLYQCLCCPDPCYQPKWVPAANASFFADYARPRTVTRIRYDNLENMTTPDRNQFWINQVKLLHSGSRIFTHPALRLQQVYLYQEAAGAHGSFFVEYPYMQINQNYAPTQAGFGNINFGLKSLLFDCEMLQVTFQMRTYMPTGNFTNNLGNGQFAVDPSILTALKLGPSTYFQGQFGNWIPVGGPGGNSKLAGGVFYWLMSLNQVLWYATPSSPLIATLEMDGWSFENGGFTSFIPKGSTSASGPGSGGIIEKGGGVSYFNIGPGLRQSVCNRLDIGGAITWSTGTFHWAQPWFRFEVRFLF